jgi:hypothetical protein
MQSSGQFFQNQKFFMINLKRQTSRLQFIEVLCDDFIQILALVMIKRL